MKRKTLAWFFSLALIVLLIGFVSTWADNGNLTQNINGCNELNTTGATYTLTSNVSSNGTCFTITAENVTLDCNGYWINYSINGTEYGRGVYTNKFNTTIRNCNIIDGNFASSGTERSGIYLYTSTYNTVSNCFISVNNSPAIILTESPFSNLINNTLKSGNRAIHLFDTNSTLIINNTGNSSLNNNLGIHLYGICSNNTFINNTILSVSYGLLLESVYPSKGVSNNILINNTFISTESTALAFSGSDNNTIVNQIAESRGAYAIDLAMSANNIFRDCINLTAPNYEITLGWDSGTFNNTLLNCSYKEEHIPVIENWMFVKWYYQAYLNYSNGTPIAGANVTAYNSFGNIEFTTLTNSSGWISRQEVTDYNATHDGRVYYSNHTLFANKSGTFNDTTTLNITLNLNKLNYFFTLEETEDSIAPTYSLISHNSTLANYSVLFSIYINDNSALNPNGQYIFSTNNTGIWINDSAVNFTSTPSWGNVSKTLNSSVGMVVGYRWYFNDNSGNTNSTGVYTLNATSVSLFPYFTIIPDNISLFYGNDSTGVYFYGTDDSEFGYYSVNDTRFLINQSGYLTNSSALGVGNYEINVTINNTLGNINWTRYKVQINKSVSEVYLYVNNLRSNVTISNGSFIWLNGTLQNGAGIINLYNNGTLINSGSSPIYNLTQFNSTGVYNITVIYPGNENYTSDYEAWFVNSSNPISNGFNQIIANHSIVDRYENIPQYYINEVKKMLVDMGGESHSMGYQNGVNLLELYDSKFQVETYTSTPPAETDEYLRLGRPHMYGEGIWTSQTGIDDLISDIDSQNDTGNPFDVFGFGWCWDMTWENLPGGTEDPVFNVRWAGSSDGGPNGSMRWGLDSEDEALTGNVVSMDNYLDAIEQYNTYFSANNIPTVAIFTTGPVDSYTDENAFQRELKHNYIRDYILENSSRILFDYADILYYNNSGNKYTEEWNDGGDIREYAQIHPDNLLNYNSTWGMEDTGDPDSDHIGEVGALRLAKAQWWMLARISGWDGQNNTAPVTSLSFPSNGSSLFSGQITFQCNLTDDYDLKNTTLYVWNSTGNLISSNLSFNISGTSNSTNINYTINNDGNYLWNCLTYDGDSVSNFSVTNRTLIISSGVDTTPPIYNSVSHNSTSANYLVLFSVNVSDETALNNDGRYIFSTNNTGTWINESAVNFTSTPSWANVSKTLNSSVGMVVGYRWYFNDDSGNTNSTEVYTFIITEDSIPGENSCGILNVAGQTYTLTSNVSSNGTCFTISATNITLDCNGYWINYSINGTESTYGIYTDKFNTTIKNCNVVDGSNWTTGIGIERYGIYFNENDNSTLVNNFVNVSNSRAIYILGDSYFNSIINNTGNGYSEVGIYAVSLYFSLFINNTFISNSYPGMDLGSGSYNNTFINNTFISNSSSGMLIYGAHNNSLTNCTITSNNSHSLVIYYSQFNVIVDSIIQALSVGHSAIEISGSTNKTLFENVNLSSVSLDIYSDADSLDNEFVNCFYNINKESIHDTSRIIRKWYYQAYVNYSNGTEAFGVNVSAYNSTGDLQFTTLTNSSGYIDRQEVIEYVNTGGTRSFWSNYTIFANLTGTSNATGILNLTTTENKMDDFLTLGGEDIISPAITINYPTGTIADITPLINVSSSESGTIWYGIDDGENITLCNSCTSSQNKFLYLEEGSHTIYVFANDSSGNNGTSSNSFTIDMNYNYYDNFNDNSSIFIDNDITWYSGTINFTGGFNYLEDPDLVSIYLFENVSALGQDYKGINNFTDAYSDPTQNTTVPSGLSGYSIHLDGNDEVCNVASFNASQNHTACWWSYPSALAEETNQFAQTCYYDTWTTGTTGTYQWRINNCGSVSQDLNILGVLHVGEWTQICQTYDSSSINRTVYIDGEYNTSMGEVAIEYDGSQQWCIGGFHGGGYWLGNIYKPMWFDRVLSSDEILSIYNGEEGSSSGNFTSYAINTTENITSITNVTWTELNTDAENNITVEVSADGGTTWYAATSGSALGQTFTGENNSIVYRVIFSGSKTVGLSDMNLSWSSDELIPGENVCGTLDSANTLYTLTQNVSSTGTCFEITAENVTLDCNGFWINYSIGGESDTVGIYSDQFNTTIRNCNIIDGNWTSEETSRRGIEFQGNNNLTIYNNFVNTNNSNAISIGGGNFANITNNTGISINGNGIFLATGFSTGIDNIAISNSTHGLDFASGAYNNTFINNTAISYSGSAIMIYYSENNTLINCTGTSTNYLGIEVQGGLYNNISYSNGSSIDSEGIRIWGETLNSYFLYNTFTSVNDYGCDMGEGHNNLFIGNTIYSFGESGIAIFSPSSNNTFINNTFNSSSAEGLVIYEATNNTFIDNFAMTIASNYPATWIYNSLNNNLINHSSLSVASESRGEGLEIRISNNTIIRDCINISGGDYDVYLQEVSINNTFINCSYDVSKENVDSGNELIRKWYYQAYVNDTSGSAVSGANISAYNSTGDLQFTTLTNSSGYIDRQEVIEYVNTGGTRSFWSNYTINATLTGYEIESNILNITETQNKIDDVFALNENLIPGENACGTLDSEGHTYTLTQNVTSTGMCFNITAQNITLDCNGFWINYSTDGGENEFGVYTNQFNTTIKNCNIVDGNLESSDAGRYGILFLDYASNGTIYNDNLITGSSAGIVLYNEANYNNISFNNISTINSYGIYSGSFSYYNIYTKNILITGSSSFYFEASGYNSLISNNATGSEGAYFEGCENNLYINNNITAQNATAIKIYTSPNSILINNTAISNGTGGHGISIRESSNITISGQTAKAFSSGGYAVDLYNQNDTIMRDCVNITGYSEDIHLTSGGLNASFINCSYDVSKENVDSGNELIRKWYYQAYVNYSNGTEAFGANISAYNSTGDLQFTTLTNSSGYIDRPEVIEYVNTGGTRSFWSNYTINATLTGYEIESNILNITETQNKIDDWFTLTESGDLTPPYFTSIPNNASLFYGNESLGVDFDADDGVGFGYYSINDTRFLINQSGYLSNISSLTVGNYEINVTINDTSNNINWTIYKVQVNQSQDSCDVYFNTSSPITHPSTFIAYTNCTSAYTLNLNGTPISNGTTIDSGATAYNISVQRTDTQNYSNTFNQQQFIINKNTEICQVLFNTTSPLTYPNTFTVWANCTSPFVLSRNATTITNNSEQALAVGAYNFSMLRNDTANYTYIYNETQFIINAAPDTTPPYFTSIPNNASLFYGNESLGVDFDADDGVGFGYYSINDTRFLINQSGYLSNASSLTVGNYEINVTINDTSNNINWTIYKVQVNQSQDSCDVYFNTSSPITHPSTFIAYTNCTSAYTLNLNGTPISNGTTIDSGATAYNISVQRTDTQNYSNTFNQQQFIINKNTEICQVLFNTTSPLTYPNTFTVWANCTSAFTLYRNGTTITNNSEQALAVGAYNFSMLRNDTANYTYIYNETQFIINAAPDTTPPYFTSIPNNASLFYGNESLGVDFDADDSVGFGYYSINDTRFLINQSGYLSNASSLTVGNYEINVTINDTSNNINWTIYKVQVNQSQDSCDVYFNTSSPITHPSTFIAYTNCTSAYTLNLNGTPISNGTTIDSGATAYNISVQRTDTQNYSNTFNQQQFIINKNTEICQVLFNTTSPLTYPNTFTVWANCTSAFTLYRNGTTITNNSEQALAVGAYNFSMLRNDTANYTYIYNETQFIINAAPDTTPPYFTLALANNTIIGQLTLFLVNVNDNSALHPNGQYIFSTNNTGGWVNDSAINFISTPSWANVTKTLNSSVGIVIGYRWYFNDSVGNTNSTEIYTLTTTEDSIPGENACGTLDSAGTTYTLTQNVSSNGTCFTVLAENVTIDCDGYWINYTQGEFGYGANITNINNITIKNCNIFGGEKENYTHGIFIYNSTNIILFNNNLNTMGDISDGISIYNSSYILIYNNTLINGGYDGHGIYSSFSAYSNITNSDIDTECYGIYLEYSSNNHNFSNLEIDVDYCAGIAINSSADNNSLSEISIFVSGYGNGIILGSDFNYLHDLDISSNIGESLKVSGYKNNITLSRFNSTNNNSVYFEKGNENLFVNNTLLSLSGNVNSSLLRISDIAYNNSFYWNNFTTTGGYYINNSNSSNKFNTSVLGNAQGNEYFGIFYKRIYDSNLNGWGDDGEEYPLNSTTFQNKWIGYGTDYGPKTSRLEDLIAPTYNLVSHNNTIAGEICRFRVNISDNYRLHPDGQYIFSTNNTGQWINDSVVNFTSTPYYVSTIKTLNNTVDKVVGYRWYFNDFSGNNNSTIIYTLKIEEEEEENSGGGGGGGSEDEQVILKPSYPQIQKGYETPISKGYFIQFNLSGNVYYLAEINDVNRFTEIINFSINSTKYSVGLNDSIKINLNNDTYYDLEASVLMITFFNTSRMLFKEINEEISSLTNSGISENSLGNKTVVNFFGGKGEDRGFKFMYIIIISILIVLISLTGYIVFIRLKKTLNPIEHKNL